MRENHSTARELFDFAKAFFPENHRANSLPIIPAAFQQFSEKECGKPQKAIEAIQQSCMV
jgi:hypothetical protein